MVRVALAQFNPTVGDVAGNTDRIISVMHEARAEGAALVVFPEQAVLGYPPKDLLLRDSVLAAVRQGLDRVAAAAEGITCVVGYVSSEATGRRSGIGNSAAVCYDGAIIGTYDKMLLPTYDVFDEHRYFLPGTAPLVVPVESGKASHRIGVTVCEDLWHDRQFHGQAVYGIDPVAMAVSAGASLLVNISASPYQAGKQGDRESLFARQAAQHRLPIVYVNQVGGNDDLVFDGASTVFDATGKVVARASAFEESLLVVDADRGCAGDVFPYPDRVDSMLAALVCGVRDYVGKCGFQKTLLGLSGGIDSALTAAIAVEALGADRVHGVAMPSRFSSDHSVSDARELASNLGITFEVIPIEGVHQAMEAAVAPAFGDGPPGVAEENIQARIRGNVLMALSNKFGWLLLTTGNKSELAVGYCTLYGDMAGGLAVISDVPKLAVYHLSRRINEVAGRVLIPVSTIEKPPSAELRADQKDTDSLPEYDELDPILEAYIERDRSVDEIVALGYQRDVVARIARLVDLNEYKRKQAPVGLKVTSRAFGTGRRMPIAARFEA